MKAIRTFLGFTALCISQNVQAQHHPPACDPRGAQPVLSVADFDGDGRVDLDDAHLFVQQWRSGEYIAFYDRNADFELTLHDFWTTLSEIGRRSSEVDRQLASAFWATEAYRNRDEAIADGFVPATPAFAGHGEHWFHFPGPGHTDYSFDPARPEGLNYDTDGRLWGVNYYYGPPVGGVLDPFAAAPEGFASDQDHWHFHAGACFQGLAPSASPLEASSLGFEQCLGPAECAAASSGFASFVWNPKFFMLHAWLYELNPCGTFAEEHPELTSSAPHLHVNDESSMMCDIDDLRDENGDGLDDDFPQSPAPEFCRWVAQRGQTIPQLGCISNPPA